MMVLDRTRDGVGGVGALGMVEGSDVVTTVLWVWGLVGELLAPCSCAWCVVEL